MQIVRIHVQNDARRHFCIFWPRKISWSMMSETQRYWLQVDLLRLVDPTEASNTSSAR
jgi:hypothetical protein